MRSVSLNKKISSVFKIILIIFFHFCIYAKLIAKRSRIRHNHFNRENQHLERKRKNLTLSNFMGRRMEIIFTKVYMFLWLTVAFLSGV